MMFIIQRSWVQTLVWSNSGCVVHLSQIWIKNTLCTVSHQFVQYFGLCLWWPYCGASHSHDSLLVSLPENTPQLATSDQLISVYNNRPNSKPWNIFFAAPSVLVYPYLYITSIHTHPCRRANWSSAITRLTALVPFSLIWWFASCEKRNGFHDTEYPYLRAVLLNSNSNFNSFHN